MGTVLVTGGAGFIGSHTIVELLNNNFDVIVVDNFINSSQESVKRVEKITNKCVPVIELDLVTDVTQLNILCKEYKFICCIHFAGLKAVGESMSKPLQYYRNNIVSTLNLLECLHANNCHNIIFSSSATVYGDPKIIPITEQTLVGVGITNPYGQTKYFIEQIIQNYGVERFLFQFCKCNPY